MTQDALKRPDMLKLVGMGYTTVWRLEKEGKFPARVRLSPGRVGWLLPEIEAWIKDRPRVVQAPKAMEVAK